MDINLLSIIFSIFLIITASFYYIFKAVEAKGKIHVFSYSMRKLFMDELEEALDRVYDIFKKRLSKNSKKDATIIVLIGIIIFVLIILGVILIPVDLNIIIQKNIINYYTVNYICIYLPLLFFLVFVPIKWSDKIYKLGIQRVNQYTKTINKEAQDSMFDESDNERRMIRFYHFIKYFGSVSQLAIFALLIQSIAIIDTPYFYYQTNLAIALLPLLPFALLSLAVFIIGRLRIGILYDAEDVLFRVLVYLPGTHRIFLLKTSGNGIFPDSPQICQLDGIGAKLKIIYKHEGKMFFSYIKWKDVVAFSFHDVKFEEAFQKFLKERQFDMNNKADN